MSKKELGYVKKLKYQSGDVTLPKQLKGLKTAAENSCTGSQHAEVGAVSLH